MTRILLVLLLSLVTLVDFAVAGVELNQSRASCEFDTVRAGTVVTVKVVLKNSGDKASDRTDVRIRLPMNGFLVRIDELPGFKWDDNEREVAGVVSIPAGEEYRFSFDLMPSHTEVGHYLTTYVEAVYLLDQVRWNTESSLRIMNAPSNAGIMLGGLRFHPAAFWLLGWLVCSGLFFVRMRFRVQWLRGHSKAILLPSDVHRIPAFGLTLMVMFPLSLMMVLGGMIWGDVQTLTSWQESQAIILDRREDVQSGKDEWRNGRRINTRGTRTPEFALKYQADEHEVISSGFITGPSVHVGGKMVGKAETDEWVRGKTIPCWYDPSDPGLVVVKRGFGTKYLIFGPLLGLLPLPMLWFGFRQLRKVSDAVRQLEEFEMDGGAV